MAFPSDQNAKIAHLLRRAGFGARPSEWATYQKMGLERATQTLLYPERTPDHLKQLLEEIGGDYVDYNDLGSVRQWWLYRMVHTRRPLEEKMTLFWHNHFATAVYKVDNANRMWRQNEMFRRYGMGSFRTLLQQVARDPAMLVWLDGRDNHVGKANENFAREVMELFTLGVGNGYTEKDVQEAARAFTGWQGGDGPGGFIYNPGAHDDGEKTVLGQSGNWHADDVCDILARHPATARFLTTKLFKFFVHDHPSKEDIDNLSKVYLDNQFEIRAVLQSIFNSDVFYSDAARFAKIKSPVEFCVMTIRAYDAPLSAARDLHRSLELMGQDLFNPPNVKGWSEGRDWINTRTLLARVGFASGLTDEMKNRVSLADRLRAFGSGASDAAPAIPKLGGGGDAMMGAPAMNAMAAPAMGAMEAPAMTAPAMGAMNAPAPVNGEIKAENAVETLWNGLIMGMPLTPARRAELVAFCLKEDGSDDTAGRLPGLFNLIVSAPEYQLC